MHPCPPATLAEMLLASAERSPDSSLYLQGQEVHTYEDLCRASAAVAAALAEGGVARGDRVLLALPDSFAYIAACYGVLRAGAVAVPHYPDTRPYTLGHVLRHCTPRGLIAEQKVLGMLDEVGDGTHRPTVLMGRGPARGPTRGSSPAPLDLEAILSAGASPDAASAPAPEDLASIVYTSGTTGRPKGVMLAHRNLLANTRSIVEYLGLGPGDRAAMVLPFFYVYGSSVLHTHVFSGGSIAQVGSLAFPAAMLREVERLACTGLSGVPSSFARLLAYTDLASHDLSSLRYLTQAGGPMTPALTRRLRQALPGARLFVMYGQTEASARLTYLPPEDLDRKEGSAGKAIPGVALRIMDQEGRELPRGAVGEIVAQGYNVMAGYWQDPAETARVLGPEGLRTGDLAFMDDEGFVFIQGRQSDMIKAGAHRIAPQEIEAVVERLAEVASCAAVGIPDELLGEVIAAFVVPMPGCEVTPRSVQRVCLEHLPRFKVPAHVRVVEALPCTPSGKLRRCELREWFAAGK